MNETAHSVLDLPTLQGTDGAITIRKWVVSLEEVLSALPAPAASGDDGPSG